MDRKLVVRAPSNIALVKYMGKADAAQNLPLNPSLSLTLNSLCTWASFSSSALIEIQNISGEVTIGSEKLNLLAANWDEKEKTRAFQWFSRLEAELPAFADTLDIPLRQKEGFLLKSGNTFPKASGIASSASAFAALTLGYVAFRAKDALLFKNRWKSDSKLRQGVALLSRMGSGSSCRSMEGPVVEWNGASARKVELSGSKKVDLVVVVSKEKKRISSSEAHRRVLTSPLFEKRPLRVEKRISQIKKGEGVAKVVFEEALEMHSLFHTSSEPFTYWNSDTLRVLHYFWPLIESPQNCPGNESPWVTMDAGPNVHVIVSDAQAREWTLRLQKHFPEYEILTDYTGEGADFELV